MTARRFVHVFATFGAGGPQVRAVQLMQRLGAGTEHVVMAMDGCTDAAAQLPAGVRCEVAPPPARRGLLAVLRAQRRWLAGQRPDLVLTYNWGAIETAAAARSLRLPLVHHEDGFLPDEAVRRHWRRSLLRRLVLRRVPVVVPSAVLQRIATHEWGLQSANVHHLVNGVDLDRFRPAARVAAPVVGTVGGLRPEKDHATLLRALAELPAARAVVVGGGALGPELRALADDLGVAGRVDWRGPVADTAPCYAAFAVFVLCSRTEQLPLVLLEAMASGLPVVATDVGDVRAVLPPEQGAFVVPPGDAGALAAALRAVLGDPALAAALGAKNRARAAERFGAGPCLQRFVDVYDRTSAAAGRR
jgi:glycosyltransferase involved in cell wall biosynthesis